MKRIEDRIAGFLFFRSGEPDCLRTHGSFPFSAISSSSGGKLFERRYQQVDLCISYITYDSLPREMIWRRLEEEEPRGKRCIVKVTRTCVRMRMGETEYFLVEIGLH